MRTPSTADFTPFAPAREPQPPIYKRQIPPYNGFGTEEDSLNNCWGLDVRARPYDLTPYHEHGRRGFDSNCLRFVARIDTDKPQDMDRRFIVTHFRSDNTFLIYEPRVRNSGRFIYNGFTRYVYLSSIEISLIIIIILNPSTAGCK